MAKQNQPSLQEELVEEIVEEQEPETFAVNSADLEEAKVNELSKDTLGSYVKKATKSAVGATRDMATGHDPEKAHRVSNKRAKGIDTAINKLTKEEETVDESAYKGKDAFGRGVIGRLRGGKAGAYLSKKSKERSDMNKKNDPGAAKKGYALSVTDKDKAMKKARKKGLSPKHPTTNYNRKLPEGEGTDEALDSFGSSVRKVAKGADKTSSVQRRMQKRQRDHERGGINEKTLTPAEKKKREDVAKAIERDNPNMPMDKKMAIATATAKRTAESSIKDRTRAIMERALNKKT